MAHAPITLGSGGGYGSDDCTGTLDYVVSGKTVIAKDSDDEPGTGRMTVNSLLSFSVAAYSGRRVLAKWQNPKAATGRPYSGVYIRYSTSGYPGKTGGTQIYKGSGNNTASEGNSQAYLDLPALSTKYYLSIYPYVTTSAGELTGTVLNATVTTSNQLTVVIKSTQNYTLPPGYKTMDIFVDGGGAGGQGGGAAFDSGNISGGRGAGSGYTSNVYDISISEGQVLSCIIGEGGTAGAGETKSASAKVGTNGGKTSVTRSGVTLASAEGGKSGGDGGSGGGVGALSNNHPASSGGTDGSDGASVSGWALDVGEGQGTSTKAFGSGTRYSPGPGGAGAGNTRYPNGAAGGEDGGAKGGDSQVRTGGSSSEGYTYSGTNPGGNGADNTGAGGAGGGAAIDGYTNGAPGGKGGSGIIILRLR